MAQHSIKTNGRKNNIFDTNIDGHTIYPMKSGLKNKNS